MGEEAQIRRYEMTQEGYDELEAELEELTNVKLKEIAQKLGEAREQGDLSENAEYDAAKNEQSEIAGRIDKIKHMLKFAVVISKDSNEKGKVGMGSVVKLLDMEFKDEVEYKIVGPTEANSLKNKLSNESPVGRAILGHKKGDTVKVETKVGTLKYKIMGVSNK
ncbi:MAG: transcription elongation factor GreA [Lachnospiraceae bacterium]|nr:transcription elongation factor GreA [Lachnospiraceae bacterium]MCR5409704.1 transcription elongation factor GreA [Lachnospiraceae bacterium]